MLCLVERASLVANYVSLTRLLKSVIIGKRRLGSSRYAEEWASHFLSIFSIAWPVGKSLDMAGILHFQVDLTLVKISRVVSGTFWNGIRSQPMSLAMDCAYVFHLRSGLNLSPKTHTRQRTLLRACTFFMTGENSGFCLWRWNITSLVLEGLNPLIEFTTIQFSPRFVMKLL